MKKIAFVVAIGAFGTLASACGGTTRTDAGVDTNVIMLADSGPIMRDAFRRPDTNEGPATCSAYPGVSETLISAMPASCTPRCSNATLGAVNACVEGSPANCLSNALMADMTPTVSMPIGTTAIDVDCGTCFDINRFHCFSLVCMTQAPAYFLCDPAMDTDMCMGELTALQTCLNDIADGSTQETTLNECFNTEVTGCFDTSGAFAPSAQAIRSVSRVPEASFSTARATLR